ncbi:MAG: TSUP family transporter, partial [Candidatus Lokiarchaeota archaeon]
MIIYLSLIAILFSSMVYGIIGFGDALVLIPIITPFIGVRNAIVLVNIWGTFPALLNFIKYRDYLDKGYFFRFVSVAVPATIFATFMIITIELAWIELVLGLFILIYSTLRLYQYSRKKDTIKLRKHID